MKRKNREKFRDHHFNKRAGFKDEHHLTPRSRGGKSIGSNLIDFDAYRHSAWHLLFKNLTLDEVIDLLVRLRDYKKSQHKTFQL
jgi:hypothetical protein